MMKVCHDVCTYATRLVGVCDTPNVSLALSLAFSLFLSHTHTYTHTYTCAYIHTHTHHQVVDAAFKCGRDIYVHTSKRMLIIDAQGLSSKTKKDKKGTHA